MVRSFAPLVLLCVAVGCGKPDPGNSAGPINSGTSNQAGNAMASSIESGFSDFDPPPKPAAGGAAFGDLTGDGDLPLNCYSYDPPLWTDTDMDFFPDVESTVTLACVVNGADGQWTLSGTYSYLDLAPGIANFNFASTYDATVLFEGTISGDTPADDFEGSSEFYYIGTDTATEGAGTFAIEQTRDTGVDVLDASGDRVYLTSEQTGWSLSYTPGATWDRGVEIIPGEVSVNGSWEVEVRAGEFHQHSASSVTTMSPLQVVDALACPTHVTSGLVRASFEEDDRTTTLDVAWLGCGIVDVTFTDPGN